MRRSRDRQHQQGRQRPPQPAGSEEVITIIPHEGDSLRCSNCRQDHPAILDLRIAGVTTTLCPVCQHELTTKLDAANGITRSSNGQVIKVTKGRLTYAEIDGPDDVWHMAIVLDYKSPQQYGTILRRMAQRADIEATPAQLLALLEEMEAQLAAQKKKKGKHHAG